MHADLYACIKWACQEWWEQTKDHNQWHVFIEWIDEFESPVVWSSCCCCPTTHSSIDRSMWASLATPSLHFLILFMRVGECLCEVFPARGGNFASVSFSLSLLENALEVDLKWLLRRLVADWSGRFALSLFWVSVPFWDLRGDTLIYDFDMCAYSCEGQSNWRAPNSQVRSDMQQLRRKVAHIHVCICINMYTYLLLDMSFLHHQLHNALKHTRAYLHADRQRKLFACICIYIYMYIHKHTHTHIYADVFMWELIDCPHFRDQCIDVVATWELIDCLRVFCVISARPSTGQIGVFWQWQEMKDKGEISGFPISDIVMVGTSMFV